MNDDLKVCSNCDYSEWCEHHGKCTNQESPNYLNNVKPYDNACNFHTTINWDR